MSAKTATQWMIIEAQTERRALLGYLCAPDATGNARRSKLEMTKREYERSTTT